MDKPLLNFRISKSYPPFKLECASAFYSGITAVFGPSGSGKTTLLESLAGLSNPDSGEIQIQSETLFSSATGENLPPEQRRIGYVFQDPTLFPHMSVLSNIEYGYKLTPQRSRKMELDQLGELLQISTLLNRGVSNLSGGQRQRVSIARAVFSKPEVIIFDEATSSLDSESEKLVQIAVEKILSNCTAIIVAHRISTIQNANKIMVLNKSGKIEDIGKHNELLEKSGTYKTLYELQFKHTMNTLDST